MIPKNLPLMTGPELAACLDKLDEIESWCRSVRAEALRRCEENADDRPPGWKIVEGRKGDRSADPLAVKARIEPLCYQMRGNSTLPPELYTEPELKSVAQMEKACKKLGPLGKAIWSAITGDPEKGIPSLITQAPGRPSLARDFDERPELAPQPVQFALQPVGQEFAAPVDRAASLM